MSSFTPMLEEAVTKGLTKAKLEDTPENRVEVMKNVYKELRENPGDSPHERAIMAEVLIELEHMIVDLENSL